VNEPDLQERRGSCGLNPPLFFQLAKAESASPESRELSQRQMNTGRRGWTSRAALKGSSAARQLVDLQQNRPKARYASAPLAAGLEVLAQDCPVIRRCGRAGERPQRGKHLVVREAIAETRFAQRIGFPQIVQRAGSARSSGGILFRLPTSS
jgi:hypothetical protein